MSVEHWGLEFSPYAISVSMGISGAFSAILQVIVLGRIIGSGVLDECSLLFELVRILLIVPCGEFFARRANGADWKV